MPFDSKQRSEQAKKRIRDQSGHFISLKPKVKVAGQTDLIAGLVHTEKETDDSSLINLKVNNPFEKILRYLKDIRDKQSTTVSMKFTIPLIALPIAILLSFQLGRYQSECNSYFSTQIGIVENIEMVRKTAPDNWFLKFLSYLPGLKEVYEKQELISQPILILPSGNNLVINNEANSDLQGLNNTKTAISGEFNSCTNTLTLDSIENTTAF